MSLALKAAYQYCQDQGWPYSINYFRKLVKDEGKIPYQVTDRRGNPWEIEIADLDIFIEQQRKEMQAKGVRKVKMFYCSTCGRKVPDGLDIKVNRFAFGIEYDPGPGCGCQQAE